MKKILALVFGALLLAVPCWAEWTDAELEPNAEITATEMKAQLTEAATKTVYVREAESEDVTAYVDTTKIPSLAKQIALNMDADQMTYIYTNDKKIYKKLASRFSYYAGRDYNFNGYRIMTGKEGGKFIDGREVFRLWVMKVERPKEVIVRGTYYPPTPPVVIDIWGWPWHHHHHHHHGPPPHHHHHR